MSSARLSGVACSRDGIAERADIAHVKAIEHVEAVGDHFEIQPLGDGELPSNPQVDLVIVPVEP